MCTRERTPSERKFLETVNNDLKQLASEARKKYPPVKEAAESGSIKVKNSSVKHDDLRLALLSESPEILEPFFLGCDTKSPKVVQISLTAIQRLITYEAVSSEVNQLKRDATNEGRIDCPLFGWPEVLLPIM